MRMSLLGCCDQDVGVKEDSHRLALGHRSDSLAPNIIDHVLPVGIRLCGSTMNPQTIDLDHCWFLVNDAHEYSAGLRRDLQLGLGVNPEMIA